MPYDIELMGDNKTIVTSFRGIIDDDCSRDFMNDVKTFMMLEKKEYFFLLDFLGASSITDSAKDNIIKLSRNLHDFSKKFAVCANPQIKLKLSQIFESLSGLSKVRIFSSKNEAIDWLWGD